MSIIGAFTRRKMQGKKGEKARFQTSLRGRGDALLTSVTADTQEEADTKLIERLRTFFRGTYTPVYLHFRGQTMLAWRDGNEWVYAVVHDHRIGGVTGGGWTLQEEVERAVRSHMAQMAWDEQEETSPCILNVEDQEKFTAWARMYKPFLATWRRLTAAGWTCEEARLLADGYRKSIDPARLLELGDPGPLLSRGNEL